MTSTDELRRLLDERGVEHWDTVGITEYRGENDRTVRCYSRPEPMTLDVAIIAAPPEQAVEATLGSDLKAENEKLREERDMYRDLVGMMDHPDLNVQLQAENAKLRELVRELSTLADQACDAMPTCCQCPMLGAETCDLTSAFQRMRELGVEV